MFLILFTVFIQAVFVSDLYSAFYIFSALPENRRIVQSIREECVKKNKILLLIYCIQQKFCCALYSHQTLL